MRSALVWLPLVLALAPGAASADISAAPPAGTSSPSLLWTERCASRLELARTEVARSEPDLGRAVIDVWSGAVQLRRLPPSSQSLSGAGGAIFIVSVRRDASAHTPTVWRSLLAPGALFLTRSAIGRTAIVSVSDGAPEQQRFVDVMRGAADECLSY